MTGDACASGKDQDNLYNRLCKKVDDLREAGFEPDRIVVHGDDWRDVKNQAEVLEGEGVLGGDDTLVNGVKVTFSQHQTSARVILEVPRYVEPDTQQEADNAE